MAETASIDTISSPRPQASAALDQAVARATAAILAQQRADGHWVFELEADATIPAEYILLGHYLDEIDESVQQALVPYLRSIQGEHGGWPLFHGGRFDLSASVKAYFALKAAGDSPEGAGGNSRPWRGGAVQRLHPHPAGAVR
jgi:squalene-hopene/tetraprenyl-beta-curcumene cyclase